MQYMGVAAATVEATKAGRRQDKVADAAAAGVKHTVLTAAVKRVDVAGCSSQQSDHDRPTSSGKLHTQCDITDCHFVTQCLQCASPR